MHRWLVRLVMIVERLFDQAVLLGLRIRGRHYPMIIPFVGHGTTTRLHVSGRVVRGAPEAEPTAPPTSAQPEAARRSRRAVFRASVALFLTVPVSRTTVTITAPGASIEVRPSRDGYLDAVVEVPEVAPGWHEVELSLPDGTRATAQVLVVDPSATIGLVSDVDDTILETGVARGLEFLRATLLTEVSERAPLRGAAALYRALVGDGNPVFYVSTSPWNLHEVLLQFLTQRRFPLGPLLLTDWGPARGRLFRIGAQEHKTGLVRRILAEHPRLDLVLVGDSGQADPEIYATLARAYPDRIRAVYIRRTEGASPSRVGEVDALAADVTAGGVPMLAVDDSSEIARHAVGLGLVPAAALPEVAAG